MRLQTNDDARLSQLHDAVVTGDSHALNELCECLLEILQRRLQRTFPRTPADLRLTAAADAILEYARRPWRYDRTRGVPLDGFLHHAASRNVLNLLQAERRRRAREQKYAIELFRMAAATGGKRDDDVAHRRRQLLAIVDQQDRQMLTAWLVNDASTDGLAAALSLSHLPQAERQRALKRFKDRIVKRRLRHALRGRALANS